MDFILRLIPVVGMGLVLFVAPVLALTTLALTVITDKTRGFLVNLGCFVGYFLWLVAGIVLLDILPFGESPWWLPFFIFWLLFGSIPHGIILIDAKHTKKRQQIWAGILGLSTTILATVGIGFLCYSARFY